MPYFYIAYIKKYMLHKHFFLTITAMSCFAIQLEWSRCRPTDKFVACCWGLDWENQRWCWALHFCSVCLWDVLPWRDSPGAAPLSPSLSLSTGAWSGLGRSSLWSFSALEEREGGRCGSQRTTSQPELEQLKSNMMLQLRFCFNISHVFRVD